MRIAASPLLVDYLLTNDEQRLFKVDPIVKTQGGVKIRWNYSFQEKI